MNHRSLQRPVLRHACLGILLLLSVLPRLTVHSHDALHGCGVNPSDFQQHLVQFHSRVDSEVPDDALHIHWVLGSGLECLPANSIAIVADGPVDHYAAVANLIYVDSLSYVLKTTETVRITEFNRSDSAASFRGQSVQLCCCVWNC